MSKSFLTTQQALTKLESAGGGASFIRKTELIATGKCDESLLAQYGNNDFVVDDDIILKNTAPAGRHLSGTMIPGVWTHVGDKRYGYYTGQGGSLTILRDDSGNISDIAVLMIQISANGLFWGPILHANSTTIDNVNRVALTFSFFNGHYMEGTVTNNGSNWWSFMKFENQDDWKQKMVDGMIANKGKQITWDIVFWYE